MISEVKVTQSCLTLCDPMDYTVHEIRQVRILELGNLSLLQGMFPTQGSNPGLLHCRRILYQLSHKGSPEKPLKIKCLLNIKKKKSRGLAKFTPVNYRLRTNVRYFKTTSTDPLSSQDLYVNKTGFLH